MTVSTPYGDPSAPLALGTVGRTPGGVPAAARRRARVPAAPDQLPRQPLGAALARRPPGAGAVRGRRAAAERRARRPRGARPAGRPHLRAARGSYVETGAVHLPFADPYCARLRERARRRADGVATGGTMVVVEGPRFSTRAESQHYAAQGWTLINMTGAPEALLAREMRLVLRPDRAGHRHGRRRRGRARASARTRSSRCSSATSSGSRRCCSASSPTCPTPTAAPARPGPTASTSPTSVAVKVLLTGSAGFIGSAIAAAARRRTATRSSRVDLHAAAGARRRRGAARGHPPPRRPRRRGLGRPARRRRRGLPPGRAGRRRRAGRRPARRTPPTTTSAPPRCSPRCTTPASTGWCSPPRWSCTARGATPAPSTATGTRRPRAVDALDAGRLREPLPGLRPAARLGSWSTRTPGSTRAAATPPARSPRSTTPRPGPGRPAAPRSRCGTTTSTAPGCPGTRRTPGSPRCSAPRSSAARRRGSSRTAARCATSCTSPTSPAPTCWRSGRSATLPDGALRGVQRLLGHARSRSARWPAWSPRGTAAARARGHRGVPPRRRPARRRLPGAGARRARLRGRRSPPRRGCARSPPRRCATLTVTSPA